MSAEQTEADRPDAGPRPVHPALLVAGVLSIAALVALVVLAFASADGTGDRPDPTGGGARSGEELVGEPLPDLAVVGFDRSEAPLSDFVGEPLVINFFAYWCTPCRAEMPAFQEVYESYGGEVRFLGLDYVDQPEAGLRMVQETGITYEVARDPSGEVLEGLGGMVMPTTVFVRADGTVALVQGGELDATRLRDLIEANIVEGAPR